MFKTNVLVLGANGMLGHDVLACLQDEALKKGSAIGVVAGIDRSAGLDLSRPYELERYILGKVHFDVCINCIAYTDVVATQSTASGYRQSYLLNALLPKHIAETCKFYKMRLIHVSTDHVFSEHSHRKYESDSSCPFADYDEPFPMTAYGQHKLLGEELLKSAFGKDSSSYAILRTSWLFGMHKQKSFVHRFIANAIDAYDAGKTISMPTDEFSVPTSTEFVCECIKQAIVKHLHGTFHAVPETSRGIPTFEFASKILHCLSIKLPEKLDINKLLVPGSRLPFRPEFTAMHKSPEFKTSMAWEDCVEKFIEKHRNELIQKAAAEKTKQV